MVKNPMDGCALPQDPHYARAYRVWRQNPPPVMLEGESEPPCVYCAKPTRFGSPFLLSSGVGRLHDLRPCACGEWHYCCHACVKRLDLAPAWRLKRGPDRDVVGTRQCPLAIRVAHEFMGVDVSLEPVAAATKRVKAQFRLASEAANPFGGCC